MGNRIINRRSILNNDCAFIFRVFAARKTVIAKQIYLLSMRSKYMENSSRKIIQISNFILPLALPQLQALKLFLHDLL